MVSVCKIQNHTQFGFFGLKPKIFGKIELNCKPNNIKKLRAQSASPIGNGPRSTHKSLTLTSHHAEPQPAQRHRRDRGQPHRAQYGWRRRPSLARSYSGASIRAPQIRPLRGSVAGEAPCVRPSPLRPPSRTPVTLTSAVRPLHRR